MQSVAITYGGKIFPFRAEGEIPYDSFIGNMSDLLAW